MYDTFMNYKILSIIVFILILLGIGFIFTTNNRTIKTDAIKENKEESLSPNQKQIKIIAFGDSLTAGYGVDLQDSYPKILENKLRERNIQATIINMGVSGETTSMSIERIPFILEQSPNIVLLGIGANDMLRSLSPEEAKKNIDVIIKSFKDANVPVVLLGMRSVASNGTLYRNSFDEIYPNLAKNYNLPLVPFFLEGVVLDPALNNSDGIHPNRAGYEKIINNNILPVLIPYINKLGL